MMINSETRQRLLELVYDLLSEAEAAELRGRIASDAEVAAAYHEAQETARLLAEAARLPTPVISPPASNSPSKKDDAGLSSSDAPFIQTTLFPQSVKDGRNRPKTFARAANWVVGLAAAILVMVSVGGYFYHREKLQAIAAEHLRLVVTGPPVVQTGVAAEYTVCATAIDGRPLPAQVEVSLASARDGRRLKSVKETTDPQGRMKFAVPADMKLDGDARLRVVAWHRESHEEAETALAVEPSRYDVQLALDRPLYQPGDTIYYRALVLSRSSLEADREFPIHFEILDPAGSVVAGSVFDAPTQRGVANSAFAIPEELAGGQYTLVARGGNRMAAERKRTFFIRQYRVPRLKKELEFTRDSYAPGQTVTADFKALRAEGGPAAGAKLYIIATVDDRTVFEKIAKATDAGAFQIEFKLPEKIERGDGQLAVVVDDGGASETQAKTIPINLGKFDVAFYPEGGDLVAGLESRVYFTARDPLGKPVHLAGVVMAMKDNEDSSGRAVAKVETLFEGRGAFSFTPEANTGYSLKITSPAGAKNQPTLPKPNDNCNVVLNAGSGVFNAGTPVEFNLRAARADIPLVVAAYCRGVHVGQERLVTRGNGEGNPVAIALDPAIGGIVRLTVYDYSQAPPKPVAERLVYRRPSRTLKVRTLEDGRRYTPGDKVDLTFQVTDEKGVAVPAVLGVAVVDDALLNLADDHTPAMPTHFLLTGQIEKPEDLEDADFYLSDRTKNKVSAAAALDLLLGTQGWRRFVERSLVAMNGKKGTGSEPLTPNAAGNAGREVPVPFFQEADTAAPPPFVYDNIDRIRDNYRRCLADYQADRTPMLNTLTAVSFVGALGLVLVVAMLGLMRICSGVRLWIPALGATTCCLIVGMILMNPGRLMPGLNGAIAFSSNAAPSAPTADTANEVAKKPQPPTEPMVDQEAAVVDKLAQNKPRGLRKAMLGQAAGTRRMDRAKMQVKQKLDEGPMAAQAMPAMAPAMPLAKLRADAKELKMDADGRWFDAEKAEAFGERKRMIVIRQYAHQHVASQPGVRTDFAETLFWHPMLIADKDGKASIHFELSDAVTAFRVSIDAHGEGRIGAGRAEITSRIPFNLEPKLPLEVSAGDRIDLPLAVVNDTNASLPVELALDAGKLVTLDGQPSRRLTLAADSRGREYFTLNVTGQKGKCDLTFRGTATLGTGPFFGEKTPSANKAKAENMDLSPSRVLTDSVNRPLSVVPPGFPKTQSFSGQLDGNKQEVVVNLPERWTPGSLEVSLSVIPSTLASLQKGLDGILQEPNGCFEQASTSNYPNVMTMQYLDQQKEAAPEVTRRAKDLMKKGYAKLTGYECKQRGYEWFGGDPGHEALTAYGLMQFRDMQQVFEVDPAMISRTAEWLLARRDGRGGYQRNPRALDSFGGAPADVTDAYITWALAESGQENIDAEVKHSIEIAKKSDDPYVVALAASTALTANMKEDAKLLLEKLAKSQADDGHLDGRQGSITRSGGQSLQIETTSLAALAWLKSPEFAARANKAVEWIIKNRQGGGSFGSTQATILALKTLVEHAKANRRTASAGVLSIERAGQTIGRREFAAGASETIAIDGIEAALKAGENRLTLNLSGDNKMPYVLNVSYRTLKPESSEACPVRLAMKLASAKVKAGETVALTAELTNATDRGQPMTVAIVGLPAGLEPRADQLEELKKAGAMDYYETRAREIVFYWRGLAPKRVASFKLDLVAAVPGRYTAPASRAYLYYTSENKQWLEPLAVEITR